MNRYNKKIAKLKEQLERDFKEPMPIFSEEVNKHAAFFNMLKPLGGMKPLYEKEYRKRLKRLK